MKSSYKDNGYLQNQLNPNFLTNNVKGLQSTKKRLKLFNFLKNKWDGEESPSPLYLKSLN